jgi:hypothetical protein
VIGPAVSMALTLLFVPLVYSHRKLMRYTRKASWSANPYCAINVTTLGIIEGSLGLIACFFIWTMEKLGHSLGPWMICFLGVVSIGFGTLATHALSRVIWKEWVRYWFAPEQPSSFLRYQKK